MLALKNGKIIGDEILTGKNLYLYKGKIAAVTAQELPAEEVIDVQGAYIAPGFIDIHTHGAGGFDFMDGSLEAVKGAAAAHLRHGTTTLLPTTLSYGMDSVEQAIAQVWQAAGDESLPNLPGVHLEGPYFSPRQAGAQDPRFLSAPKQEEYEGLLHRWDGFIRRWSFAPELPGAAEFCRALTAHGVAPSVGHSDAEYSDVLRAYEAGCKTVTHLYSGMSTIVRKNAYRVLGVVESAYLLEDMMVEVIADGCHLPPELLRLVYRQKGPERICLVTDSMRGAGMPDGLSMLGRLQDGVPCVIEDGVAKLPDRSAFAGSVATFDRLVRVMHREVGVPLTDCAKMASTVPARVLGLQSHKGRIAEGYDADLVVFDEDITVWQVFVSRNGRVVRHDL